MRRTLTLATDKSQYMRGGHLRWECSVSSATLDPMIWSVGDVVVNELAHLKDEAKFSQRFLAPLSARLCQKRITGPFPHTPMRIPSMDI